MERYHCFTLSAGDVNGDGKVDLLRGASVSRYPTNAAVLLGNGDGSFRDYRAYQDGQLDLLLAHHVNDYISVFLNRSK